MKKKEVPIFQHMLAETFRCNGKRKAIEYNGRTISYEDLERLSQSTLHWIKQRNLPPETFIALSIDDRVELIAAIIGILNAGCVFVPLDQALPPARLRAMMASTHTRYLMVDEVGMQSFGSEKIPGGLEIIQIDLPQFHGYSNENETTAGQEPVEYGGEDRIYVYFTSGSTGTPKGIVGKNRGLAHFIQWEIETFGISPEFRVSQFITPGFDAFLRDVFVPLCAGATLCIPENKDIILDTRPLIQWIDERRISLMHGVPGFFRLLCTGVLDKTLFQSLKYVMLSGEPIHPPDLQNWYYSFGKRVRLVNFYGPTETTMIKSYYLVQPADAHKERIPIGKPMKGARLMVCDEKMNLCAPLVKGDIYIRTPFRTHGYYENPEANAQRFIANPFNNDPNDLLYKTGDTGCVLPDGNYEFIGRKDRQIKIRGIRIEPEEIETILKSHPGIDETAVVKTELSPSNHVLTAYFTCANDDTNNNANADISEPLDEKTLKDFLSLHLPPYMIPAQIVPLGEIPRKPNGKIDFSGLPKPGNNGALSHKPPENPVQEKLLDIWQTILGGNSFGIDSDFHDCGGHSLNIMALISAINKEFDIRVSLADIFRSPTIEKQAQLVANCEQ